MDDKYQINLAKTDFREGYHTADVQRVLSVFHPSGFTDMSEGAPSKYGSAALAALRERLERVFAEFHVRLTPIIIDIAVTGDIARDYGWHEFILMPKKGGEPIRKRQRYFELWSKDAAGQWKISMFFSNSDVPEELNGFVSSWFISERLSAGPAGVVG
jgi:ketosteroid isomerase-like protein